VGRVGTSRAQAQLALIGDAKQHRPRLLQRGDQRRRLRCSPDLQSRHTRSRGTTCHIHRSSHGEWDPRQGAWRAPRTTPLRAFDLRQVPCRQLLAQGRGGEVPRQGAREPHAGIVPRQQRVMDGGGGCDGMADTCTRWHLPRRNLAGDRCRAPLRHGQDRHGSTCVTNGMTAGRWT